MEQLLKEIRERIEKETRGPEQLYAGLKQTGLFMLTTNTMSRAQVVDFCASLIKLYDRLKPAKQ